jgi:Fur family ferric uptake transcriptional regulator
MLVIIDIEFQYQLEGKIMTKEMQVFINFLREKNLKLTDQRKAILSEFNKIGGHLTVEQLYEKVKKKKPSIGQATVFRTLKLLCQTGIAQEINIGDKKIRYEKALGRKHHNHLICIKCGKIIEFKDDKIEKLQDKICKKFGFQPVEHKLGIRGYCSECKR